MVQLKKLSTVFRFFGGFHPMFFHHHKKKNFHQSSDYDNDLYEEDFFEEDPAPEYDGFTPDVRENRSDDPTPENYAEESDYYEDPRFPEDADHAGYYDTDRFYAEEEDMFPDEDTFFSGENYSGYEEEMYPPLPRKRSGKNNLLYTLLMLLLVAVMIVSGALFLRDMLRYKAASDEYRNLAEYFSVEENAGSSENTAGEKQDPSDAELPAADYPRMDIDFKALTALNSDFTGILYIPALDIRYPVVHSKNNAEYLSRTFEGKANPSGSIFLDCYASGDLSDSRSLIYGHNMKNGGMFGKLGKFYSDNTLCANDPWFYIYLPGKVMKYHIFSYHTTPVDSFIYDPVRENEDYQGFVSASVSASAYKDSSIDFSSHPRLMTLSTCWGTGHTENFVVQGALAAEYDLLSAP